MLFTFYLSLLCGSNDFSDRFVSGWNTLTWTQCDMWRQ